MRSTRGLFVLAGTAVAGFALWRAWRPFPVRVAGASMEPTLFDSDLVLASVRPQAGVGDVVIVRARGIEMIKRVTSVQDGLATLEGDNTGGTTKLFTPIEEIAGVALWRYWPAPRRL